MVKQTKAIPAFDNFCAAVRADTVSMVGRAEKYGREKALKEIGEWLNRTGLLRDDQIIDLLAGRMPQKD